MAPATLAGATRRRAPWDRESIINAIREWVATYGEPPRAADWNPSSAKWSGQLWRVDLCPSWHDASPRGHAAEVEVQAVMGGEG